MKKKKKRFNCPGEMTLSLIGGKWKLILLYNMRRGAQRFGELKRQSPGITPATLNLHLKELVVAGFIKRNAVATDRLMGVEYSLTPKGQSLKPIITSLIRWGLSHQKEYVLGEFGMEAFQK